jgi:hypothetical protein
MRIVGIDYSLSSPCVCVFDGEDFSYDLCKFYYLTNNKKYDIDIANIYGDAHQLDYKSNEQRYYRIATWAMRKIDEGDMVYMEGYSMGSTGMVFNIAENTGLLKHYLFIRNLGYSVVPPTVIKKFATGKGNANKERLQECFIKETGIDVKKMLGMTEKQWNPSSDIIDAYYIAKFGYTQEKENVELD